MIAAPSRPPRGRPDRRWPRRRPLTAIPAWALAILGLVGLLSTIRSAPPTPPVREPVRFAAGAPLAARLIVVLAPQLDERGAAALREGLGTPLAAPRALFTIGRPGFASFDEVSLQLLAGNVAGGVAPPTSADLAGQPPDTVARGVAGQERGVALIGPEEWRALFGLAAPPAANPAPAPLKSAALLAETGEAVSARRAALVLVQLRDLNARELREDGGVRGGLAALGVALDPRDALLIVAGGGGGALRASLSGAGTRGGPTRALAPNDFAPLCAVLLGAPYPSEARGRIAWPLLVGDERQKAEATAGLARQRTALVANSLPFGSPYPAELLSAQEQHPPIDAAIDTGQYAYAYQLAASVVDQADRLLIAVADAPTLPVPRRAAPWLAAAALAFALYAFLLAFAGRVWGTLGAAFVGGLLALGVWVGSASLLQRLVAPHLAFVVALAALHALVGGGVCVWLVRLFLGQGPVGAGVAGGGADAAGWRARSGWRATELLVLLAALPIAVAAYRYGLPWRLRLEETAPLFRWRSALIAPAALLLLGYAWTLRGAWRARRGVGKAAA
ncbi:MAG: hypothetical protein AVDCRST_MAG18-3128 [uncultured Thermomicrobiales bacterium]|uniref:Uncharacterized protein n=1 Tax=uncultured Thermomicrobiales bacterium TaxID=1645740 RepID=A0A6J4VK13_9BACT|nr:MAG: hypothetical protein AVDCRST_MAG18-3128 [uncultured Thermomicrobiales bacterium]